MDKHFINTLGRECHGSPKVLLVWKTSQRVDKGAAILEMKMESCVPR